MKRIALRALLFLLLGAAINVAVAWGCVAHASWDRFAAGWEESRSSPWPIATPERWPAQAGLHLAACVGGLSVQRFAAHVNPPPSPARPSESKHYLIDEIEAGWPLRSLRYQSITDFVLQYDSQGARPAVHLTEGHPPPSIWRDGLPMPDLFLDTPQDAWKRLPVGPLWIGLAVNTGLSATMVFFCVVVPQTMRRAIRTRRGRCPACAYPVGPSPVCTECGKPVKPRTVVAA